MTSDLTTLMILTTLSALMGDVVAKAGDGGQDVARSVFNLWLKAANEYCDRAMAKAVESGCDPELAQTCLSGAISSITPIVKAVLHLNP